MFKYFIIRCDSIKQFFEFEQRHTANNDPDELNVDGLESVRPYFE